MVIAQTRNLLSNGFCVGLVLSEGGFVSLETKGKKYCRAA